MIDCEKIKNMPSFLDIYDIKDWWDKFNALIDDLFLFEFNEDIILEFSDEEKTEVVGCYSKDEILGKIRSTWKTNTKIDKILDEVNSAYEFGRICESIISEMQELNSNLTYDELYSKGMNLFQNIYDEMLVLGEYYNDCKTIILYKENIINFSGKMNYDITQTFESTFIHELFHACHYKDNPMELVRRHDYTSKVCMESLAAAFEWHYRTHYRILKADDLEDSWQKHSVFSNPYSGANRLIDYHMSSYYYTKSPETLNLELFFNVFDRSIKDMDAALRELLDENDFYKIKNAKYYKTVVTPITTPLVSMHPQCFKLNQTKSFSLEISDGYAFARDEPRNLDLKKVKKGDIVFCIFGGNFLGVGVAISDNYFSIGTHGRGEKGIYVDVDYCVFPKSIRTVKFKSCSDYPIFSNDFSYIRKIDSPDFARLILEEARINNPSCEKFIDKIFSIL